MESKTKIYIALAFASFALVLLLAYCWYAIFYSQITTKDWLLGNVDYTRNYHFKKMHGKYTNVQHDLYLHRHAYSAFKKMHKAAASDGVTLLALSATRNFANQKIIWENKWNRITFPKPLRRAQYILNYSAMPGISRHHWGTEIDLNSFKLSYYKSEEGIKAYEWLVNNAAKFGYCQTYNPRSGRQPYGYKEEKWHWSYMPIAGGLLTAYRDQITYADITGFEGADTATAIQVIEKYALNINPKC